jgi:hypothetical protein
LEEHLVSVVMPVESSQRVDSVIYPIPHLFF